MVHFTGSDIVLFVTGFFLPPVAVLLKKGCGSEFLISVCLTLLGHVPGILYAWYVIYENREDPRHPRHSIERRTYVAVASEPPAPGANVVVAGVPQQHHHHGSNNSSTTHHTTTSSSGPGRTTTTYTTTTTKYVTTPGGTQVVVDKKDTTSTNPPH